MSPARPFPYLYKDRDRRGRTRWRLRLPGRKTVTIKGAFGSEEFAANYRAAVAGDDVVDRPIGTHGTIDHLCRTYLQSAAFAELADETKKGRRRLVEGFAAKYGRQSVAGLKPEHIKIMMDRLKNKPGVARNTLSMLRVLMALAITDRIRNDDPTANIKRPKLSSAGWHSWSEDEIAIYEKRHPIGTRAGIAEALAVHTGQRAGDLYRMGRQHIRNGRIR
jgi:integrase